LTSGKNCAILFLSGTSRKGLELYREGAFAESARFHSLRYHPPPTQVLGEIPVFVLANQIELS